MLNNKIVKVFSEMAHSFKEGLKPEKEVKISIILDKEDPSNLAKAYLIARTRSNFDEDRTWKFAYKSKLNVFYLQATEVGSKGFLRRKTIFNYKLAFLYGEEFKRFNAFSMRKEFSYFQVQESLKEACRVATLKYLRAIDRPDWLQFVC